MIRVGLRDRGAAGRRDVTARPARLRRGAAAARRARRLRGSRRRGDAARTCVAALEHGQVRLAGAGDAGRVAVLDLLRARTRAVRGRCSCSGSRRGRCPAVSGCRRSSTTSARRALGARLERPDQVSRDRYLFYTACTRATRRLYLVREAATDDGGPREPSPFWDEVAALFAAEDVARATIAPPALRAHLVAGRRADRPRAPAGARAGSSPPSCDARPCDRRRERLGTPADARAHGASTARRGSRTPTCSPGCARRRRSASTELERFADCSSAWLFERDRRSEDDRRRGRPDAPRLGRPPARCTSSTPGCRKSSAHDRVTPENVERAVGFLRRCLDDALRGGVRLDLTRAAGGRARGGAVARPRGVRPRRGALAAAAGAAPVRGLRSARSARRPSCSAACRSVTGFT